ncbi:MAG TPA: hypothetical protein VMD75_10570 [Candidatus Binataceae bacterium]|nr:hypothetical protein [Candidatus Binataceae bacterium]
MATKRGEDLETIAKKTIDTKFTDHINLAFRICNLASQIVQIEPEKGKRLSKAEIVRTLLLQRVIADLRCLVLDAERGYGIQSVAHATSIFEAWLTIEAVRDEADAKRWLNHTRTDISFDQVKTMLRKVLAVIPEKKSGDRERLVNRHYEHYSELCMVKHLNPIIERARGYIREDKQFTFVHGPDISEKGLQHVLFALDSGVLHAWYCLLGVGKHGLRLTGAMAEEMEKIRKGVQTSRPKLQ